METFVAAWVLDRWDGKRLSEGARCSADDVTFLRRMTNPHATAPTRPAQLSPTVLKNARGADCNQEIRSCENATVTPGCAAACGRW